ncbi:1,4-alpha-glucan branching protein GlgB [Pontibacter sp. Tf4]|uniref:1,4-alpha-glucan branching protein GlgB n=1 Tax=Pontibacter sp. Tf4 TaxID=2761620 RepID=UPI0016271CD4|nr:1,4-alpha-glucan branching protein GlgB [Pontibacter sp. Tf4]MBB6611730.1 1,4-alpha-glucan branching protein GlgB [Pontibacter sp. Tf4]
MAKKKLEQTPETNLNKPLTDAGSNKPAAKRGRPKKADLAAEMGAPVTIVPATETTPPAVKSKRTRTKAVPVETTDLTPAPKVRATKKAAAGAATIAEPQTIVQQEKRAVYHDVSRFTEFDIYLFKEGRHFTLYDKMGAHCMEHAGQKGTCFAVWAPNAERVTVIGDFNHWNRDSHSLKVREDGSGIWEGFIPDLTGGELYKYHIKSNYHLYHVEKSDPFAFAREKPPQTASRISDLKYEWQDHEWMERRKTIAGQAQPMSVYEVHLGSWRRRPEDNNRPLTYHELAEELPQYVKEMGFTHVEFMPVMYHPFMGSWGYQITGYFAAASVYGSPQELMHLIDVLHQHGIGVILDWVPSHFPSDEHGLAYFDGTHLYEHADPRKGYHPDWNSYIFNYGRNEVRSFLISNALFWLDKYHVDGLRVDAVASMLYLDYSRKDGEWIPNEHGGRENLEAISLIKDFNQAVHEKYPDVQTIAEESTAWPAVTGKVNDGGLGFDMKWMMGWMHDTLAYFSRDPIYRKHHQGEITFSIIYAFSERFMLPLSHDEVVHGKGSLIRKMPGDEWQQFANLRMLYSYMYAHPGTKLMFMGGELAQSTEWNHDSSLEWHLLQYHYHSGVQRLLQQLNKLYQQEPALYEHNFDSSGFEWVDFQDAHNSVISFLRKGNDPQNDVLIVCNFTPVVHENYRLGVPHKGEWVQLFNSDDEQYGGSNVQNQESLQAAEEPSHGRDYSLTLKLPPLAVVYFKFRS